jgi:DNA-binding transcriptional LysR family regulator
MQQMHSLHHYMPIENLGDPLPNPSVNLSAIDLNLLVVFDAVMQERSVTRAGRRLALSQPAMSHALVRLRHALKDDLFVRSPKGMVPTPRADELAAPIREALDGLRRSLEPPYFDPSNATRSFRVAVDNYAAIVLVAPLAVRAANIAPGVTLEFRPSGTLNVPELLDRGQLDLAVGQFGEQGERFARRVLLHDKFVVLLRKLHPALRGELTPDRFAALSHLEISSIRPLDFIDEALARRKLQRRIALRAPFLSAVRILVACDVVTVLPGRIAQELIRYRPLVLREVPLVLPNVEAAMIWPRWFSSQPAHRWLRENVERTAKELQASRA